MGHRTSKSASTSTTTNTDARVVADAGAIGFSGSSNVINVTSADTDLIKSAFDYLEQADAMITDRNNSTLSIAGNTAKAVIDAGMKAGADAVSAATNTLSTIERARNGESSPGVFSNPTVMAALIGAAALVLVKA